MHEILHCNKAPEGSSHSGFYNEDFKMVRIGTDWLKDMVCEEIRHYTYSRDVGMYGRQELLTRLGNKGMY